MSIIITKVFNRLTPKHNDDFVDRANYLYTSTMFGVLALTIGAKQYVGEPLQCWHPAQFSWTWQSYVESYCFIENTYFVDMEDEFPKEQSVRTNSEIAYYQWVPLLLGLQMLAFYLSKIFFDSLNFNISFTVENLVGVANKITKTRQNIFFFNEDASEETNQLIRVIGKNFSHRCTLIQTGKRNRFSSIRSMFHRSGDTKLYLLYKFVNLANSLGQVFLLNRMFWPEYDLWGYQFVRDLMNNLEWKQSGEFPRVTFCDVDIREIAEKPVRYTLQCVLQINMFNEKVYIFVWFWLLALSLLNALNLIWWFWCTHFDFNLYAFVDQFLSYKYRDSPLNEAEVERFVHKFLFIDGVTVLRLVDANSGPIVTADIVDHLWNYYKDRTKIENNQTGSEQSNEMETSMYLASDLMTQSTLTTSTSATNYLDTSFSNVMTMNAVNQRLAENNNLTVSDV